MVIWSLYSLEPVGTAHVQLIQNHCAWWFRVHNCVFVFTALSVSSESNESNFKQCYTVVLLNYNHIILSLTQSMQTTGSIVANASRHIHPDTTVCLFDVFIWPTHLSIGVPVPLCVLPQKIHVCGNAT